MLIKNGNVDLLRAACAGLTLKYSDDMVWILPTERGAIYAAMTKFGLIMTHDYGVTCTAKQPFAIRPTSLRFIRGAYDLPFTDKVMRRPDTTFGIKDSNLELWRNHKVATWARVNLDHNTKKPDFEAAAMRAGKQTDVTDIGGYDPHTVAVFNQVASRFADVFIPSGDDQAYAQFIGANRYSILACVFKVGTTRTSMSGDYAWSHIINKES